jgi:hypothetical protein
MAPLLEGFVVQPAVLPNVQSLPGQPATLHGTYPSQLLLPPSQCSKQQSHEPGYQCDHHLQWDLAVSERKEKKKKREAAWAGAGKGMVGRWAAGLKR